MVAKLSTTINKIQSLPNFSNIKIINELLVYMKNNGSAVLHTKSEEGLIKQSYVTYSEFNPYFFNFVCFCFYYYKKIQE